MAPEICSPYYAPRMFTFFGRLKDLFHSHLVNKSQVSDALVAMRNSKSGQDSFWTGLLGEAFVRSAWRSVSNGVDFSDWLGGGANPKHREYLFGINYILYLSMYCRLKSGILWNAQYEICKFCYLATFVRAPPFLHAVNTMSKRGPDVIMILISLV